MLIRNRQSDISRLAVFVLNKLLLCYTSFGFFWIDISNVIDYDYYSNLGLNTVNCFIMPSKSKHTNLLKSGYYN